MVTEEYFPYFARFVNSCRNLSLFFAFLYFSQKHFFFYHGFLSRTLTTHRTAREGRGPSFIHSTTSTRSRIIRHLFATLHVRWLSHIFNRTTCIYQTATRWYLPTYRITISLIDDVTFVFVCLRDDLFPAILLQQF